MGLRVHADELALSGGAMLAAELKADSADHLLFIGAAEIAALAASGTVAVVLPGTAWWMRSRRAPARELIGAGVPVAIASDSNPGTCCTESLAAVAVHACLDSGLSVEETLTGMTLNAAASLGLAAETGSLEPGKSADLVILDAPDDRHLIYHWGVNLVGDRGFPRPRGLDEPPMTDFSKLTLDGFLAALSSDAPTPGGGTAAATAGAMGAVARGDGLGAHALQGEVRRLARRDAPDPRGGAAGAVGVHEPRPRGLRGLRRRRRRAAHAEGDRRAEDGPVPPHRGRQPARRRGAHGDRPRGRAPDGRRCRSWPRRAIRMRPRTWARRPSCSTPASRERS